MFVHIVAALLAWCAGVAWILSARGKVPPNRHHLRLVQP
jgi:hypothetical protein